MEALKVPPCLMKYKLLYFTMFAAFGTFGPLMSLLLCSYGLSPTSIGTLGVISPGQYSASVLVD
jgi:MFS_1 like family